MCRSDGLRRVLVVDDEHLISETLALILGENGYATRATYSGEEAVDLARVFLPDLLITDVVMKGMTGIEAPNEILSFLPSCKVILFSGQATTVDLHRHCQRTGSNFEILSKPVSVEILLERMAERV